MYIYVSDEITSNLSKIQTEKLSKLTLIILKHPPFPSCPLRYRPIDNRYESPLYKISSLNDFTSPTNNHLQSKCS